MSMRFEKLKVYVPDRTDQYEKTFCTPFFYPFLETEKTEDEIIETYGDWIRKVSFVDDLHEADVVVLFYELLYYFNKNKVSELVRMNDAANAAGKITVCWVKGDHGITPHLKNFHLYRVGGYKSKNEGNQFCIPVFIVDPVQKYFQGTLPEMPPHSVKPVIGFCGQGRAGLLKASLEITRGLQQRLLKITGKRVQDLEELKSTTYKRSNILDALERTSAIKTNFIRHKKYRAGLTTKEEKELSSQLYFRNMADSQYVVCYRGAGNFSVRLFETLASGRIPVIIRSDNNLPFEDDIDWHIFPVIPAKDWSRTGEIVAAFHNNLSKGQFLILSRKAREIWEDYLSYKGFFKHFLQKYQAVEPVSVSA